jgi:hypothetical protein
MARCRMCLVCGVGVTSGAASRVAFCPRHSVLYTNSVVWDGQKIRVANTRNMHIILVEKPLRICKKCESEIVMVEGG